MDVDVPVLSGTLNVSPQLFSSFNRISKKKLQKHCMLFRASRHGLQRLEILDKENDKNPKIITLENCIKITQEPTNQINIVKKGNEVTHTLFALNETDLKNWIEALQSVAFNDKLSTLSRTSSVRKEENDLYCTSFTDGIFTVNYVRQELWKIDNDQKISAAVRETNKAAENRLKEIIEKKLHIENDKPIPTTFVLQLTASEIQLKYLDVNGAIFITQWPYRFVREYGYKDGNLIFEVGRKCETGEGEFRYQHVKPVEVFRCLAAKMKSMKKLLNGETIGGLDCGEHQFNAALSMEAGSRSPLPPSPNQNYSESSQSQNSHLLHGFLSSTDSLNNISMSTSTTSSIPPAIMKITPCKPPRKSIPENNGKPVPPKPSPKSTKYQDYEPVSLAQTGTGTSDLSKPTSIVLKSSPPPPLPTSPIPSNGNLSKNNILTLNSDHPIIKSPVHSPVVDQPPRIPARYESMIHDDRNYEQIENITSAWKTLGVNDVRHTENPSTTDDDFTDFVWQRSQSQKEFGSARKIPITVNAYDAEVLTMKKKNGNSDYDTLSFEPKAKPINPNNDYRTIVTITSPVYKKQTSQPITSNDYEIIGDCATITTTTTTNNLKPPLEPKPYRLADDHMGYGILRKPITNINSSPKSPSNDSNTIGIGTSSSADDLVNHRKFNGLNYAIVNKSNQV